MLVPKLRFLREDGTDYPDWKSKQLQSIFIERNETQTITEDAPLLSFTIEQGVINPEEKKTNKRDFLIKDKDNKKYALTEYNDIIYNPANLKFGAIHRNKLGRGVVSPIYAIFQTDENPVFMEYIVTNPVFIKKSLKYLEGTVIKLMTLKPRDFLLMKCCIPCIEEQEKIADFLSAVDEVIAQSEAEVQNLEQQKKAAMQKIFSQEVRFKRENGTDYPEWEEKKFGTIMDCYSGGTPSSKNKQYYNGKIPFIRSGEIHFSETELFLSEEGLNKSAAKMVKVGDLLYALYGATSGEVDISKINGAINQAILCIIPYSDNRLYLKFWLESFKTVITTKLLQGGQGNLSAELIKSLRLPIPHIEEQQKIADFLSAYDEAISYAKQELDKWKELKKGLLQQMFV
ncbi:MAG: restriction endonuclease subunit S [Lachnospiraceae bacterium]|nr:restriction endonuclease subunit S [Lachnospiraceae bacterium]